MEQEANAAIQELERAIEDALKIGETEWEKTWETFDREGTELINKMLQELLRQGGFTDDLPDLVPGQSVARLYLLVSEAVDLLATLGSSLSGIPAQILVKLTVLRFPIPRKWHQRVVPLDDGIRLGVTLMTSALLDTIQSPTLPLETFIKRWVGKVKLTRFLRSIPDFDPLEAAKILRGKVVEIVLRVLSALLTIGMILGVLSALILLAIRLNDPAQAARIVPFALPQDAPRKSVKGTTRARINSRRGEEP